MKRHTVTLEEVEECLTEPIYVEIIKSFGRGSHKSLAQVIILGPGKGTDVYARIAKVHYLLKDHGGVEKYFNLALAVEAYNSRP